MKNIILLLIILSLSSINYSQIIKLNIKNTDSKSASLFSLKGEKLTFVDSTSSLNAGKFSFSMKKLHVGFYRFAINKQQAITCIYDGNDIEIEADADKIIETIEVIKSESNKLYHEFVKLSRDYKIKNELLQLVLARYPKNDNYYEQTKQKLNELQHDYLKFVNEEAQKNPESFIARYIKSAQLPVISTDLQIEEQLDYVKNHSLDNVDFNDAELIYSDCFTNKAIEYFTYFRNPQLPMSLLEKEFQKAADSLLTKASVNILVYEHVADYLIDGFKQFGFDNVVDYIIENYVVKDDLCLDDQTENFIEIRINQNKLLKVGSIAPQISLPDTSGNLIDLSIIEKEKVLLIFYASWCPHCQDMLPEIYKLYKQRNDLEVVAISVDEDRGAWINFIKDYSLDWINVSDLRGWDSPAAQSYYIYATPTMFLLNSNREIIGKPITINETIIDLNK